MSDVRRRMEGGRVLEYRLVEYNTDGTIDLEESSVLAFCGTLKEARDEGKSIEEEYDGTHTAIVALVVVPPRRRRAGGKE